MAEEQLDEMRGVVLSDLSKLETLLPGFELEVRRESKRTIRLGSRDLMRPADWRWL